MVHGLAAQSGGKLELSSIKGQGTTVSLWLPVAADSEASESPDGSPQEAAVKIARGLRVLVVDDDPLVRMGTAAMLEDLGHQAIETSSGAGAVEILSSDAGFDLVITDHAMPGMTGADLARLIFSTYPKLPVILATGYAELPEGQAMADLLRMTKPFTQEQLQAALQRAIAERASAA